ncbi:tumor susceptibility gene 101 protein-like isoform X2 [Acanthaster planci]|uniref:Tumor susceptibility gene 101 protein-like isoform X2 n=1 Tax=Acanthaster planci TaxID=133434 RepID=A0A8B7Y067_ACAPL|nr:tumor susceptibility gene 101 protein-like isoform X2 [Acanthaster planci]
MATPAAAHVSYIKQYLPTASPAYQRPAETERDVLQVFSTFKDVRPKMDTYGTSYNIPICIWVMETHPYNPPLCFVKPTKDMLIKPSKYVDANGKVYLPYLHDWKYPSSDLHELIQVMSAVFGESPPVFSRPSQPNPPPRPSYLPGGQPAGQTPYPSGGYNMPMPMPPSTQPSYNPGYPSSTSFPTPSQYPNSYPNTNYPSSQPPSYLYPPSQPPAGPASSQPHPTASDLPVGSGAKSAELSDDEIKASIRSAVEDKMKRRLKDIYEGLQAEMDSLTITKDKLKSGHQQLEDMINKLEKEQVDLEKNIQLLQQKDEEIQAALSKIEGQEEMNIDEAIVPTTPLYKQLLNLFAEEMTIEDTYYYLMEALRKNTIELEAFLKHVRELSRKQFLLRAHIQKVRQTAGLRDLVM